MRCLPAPIRFVASMLALACTLVLATGSPTVAEGDTRARVALVVGNSAYRHITPLANASLDASLVAASLREVGFEVALVQDADLATLRAAIRDLSRRLASGKAVGFVYFSGHGAQIDGANYLVPVDARIADYAAGSPADRRVGLSGLLTAISSRDSDELRIIVLDACRTNPINARGLAGIRQKVPRGVPLFVAYATAPEDTADDGGAGEENGPYARHLAAEMKRPWLSIDRVFAAVHDAVVSETQSRQFPWHTRSFAGDFYFKTGTENDFWGRLRDTRKLEDFGAFLRQFPHGRFARNACVRRLELMARDALPAEQQKAADLPARLRIAIADKLADCPEGHDGEPGAIKSVFRHSSERLLTDDEVTPLDCDRLWIARNEMFYRNGYCFRFFEANRHFGNRGCSTSYDSIFGDKTEQSFLQRSNVYKLQAFEARRHCPARR